MPITNNYNTKETMAVYRPNDKPTLYFILLAKLRGNLCLTKKHLKNALKRFSIRLT